jgi:ketosteroid isomerase-like protein
VRVPARVVVACAAVLVSAAACAPAAPSFTAARRAAIVDSVQVMLTSWRDAFNARDFARAASFYSNDPGFRWFENGELKFRTARELGDTMKAEAPRFQSLAMSLIEPEITPVAPGVAEVTSDFAEKVTDMSGQSFGLAGAMSMTVVHGDSGWKFLVGHLSVAAPVVDTARKAKGRRS